MTQRTIREALRILGEAEDRALNEKDGEKLDALFEESTKEEQEEKWPMIWEGYRTAYEPAEG